MDLKVPRRRWPLRARRTQKVRGDSAALPKAQPLAPYLRKTQLSPRRRLEIRAQAQARTSSPTKSGSRAQQRPNKKKNPKARMFAGSDVWEIRSTGYLP